MMLARRAFVDVSYMGVNITDHIQKDLLGLTYTDNAFKNADDIKIILKDQKGKWLRDWFPEKGDTIQASIHTLNWRKDEDKQILPCGSFIVDDPEYSGRPRTLNIKAISIPSNSNFTEIKRSRAWKNINLQAIATNIAQLAGLQLFFASSINPIFQRIEQTETSDMSFLAKKCEEEGLACKVTDQQIIIFSEKEYEQRQSIAKFSEFQSTVLSYDLNTTLNDTKYAGCKIKYFDATIGKLIEYLFSLKEIDPKKDKIYELNARAQSLEEAKRITQNTLRNLNKKEYNVSLTVAGNTEIVGGCCVDLIDFGKFNGKYFVDKATHFIGNGYTTTLDLHKCLEGY